MQFQPGHLVRGIDFSEDPLLQGRIFSYLDTQLNRHGGPNFEQLPINRPLVPIHNNNRDGAAQQFIPLNTAAYSPNTVNSGSPRQASQNVGNGFFTSPSRSVGGNLVRATSPTFADVYSQPRLFFNSLIPAEQQFLVNAMRFELSHVSSPVVKTNVIFQLNRVSNDLATRVASALNLTVPAADPTYYNSNSTAFITIFGNALPTIATLKVAVLASVNVPSSLAQANAISQSFATRGVTVTTIGENLSGGVNETYSAADGSTFDGIIVAAGAEQLFLNATPSTLFPQGRPSQILTDAYRWGKPVGALGGQGTAVLTSVGANGEGVYLENGNVTDVQSFVGDFEAGLKTFRFVGRFVLDA